MAQLRRRAQIGIRWLLPLAALLTVTFDAGAATARQLGPWRWEGVERIEVVPDVHGAYTELTELLVAAGIVDTSLRWTGGATHLVSLGDLLDRGAQSRQVMDLLMRLQREAPEQGGRVHVVAGNHETMNLLGDLRYVAPGEYAALADMEPPGVRERAYRDFLEERGEAGENSAANRAAFEERYPPGYFGHRSAFSPGGVYGSWLLSLPAIIVINDTAFVHGGLPEVAAVLSLDELNSAYHADLTRFFDLWRRLLDAGILTRDDLYDNLERVRWALRIADPASCPSAERSSCARERGAATQAQRNVTPQLVEAMRELLALLDSPLFGPTGPQWYRGSVRCRNVLEAPLLQAALDNLEARRVVVGHTPTTDRRVHLNMDGRLVMLDTGMLVSRYRGRPALLTIEPEKLEVLYLNPTERVAPLGQGGNGYYPLDDDQLLDALAAGDIREIDKAWFGGSWNVELAYRGLPLNAIFYPADDSGSHRRELAAYRLDRALGFELVPPSVPREIDGLAGTLQLSYADPLSESERRRKGWPEPTDCPLPRQLALLEAFDLLIGNGDRSGSSMIYPHPLWRLQAIGHADAFGRDHALPAIAEGEQLELPRTVRDALLALNRENLEAELGGLLDEQQLIALLARRNTLFSIVRFPAASYGPPATAATGDRPR